MLKLKISLIDYGVGNLFSVEEAFKFLGCEVSLCKNPEEVRRSDIIVLSGVGSFASSIEKIKQKQLFEAIDEHVKIGKPLIGICLGMQLFATTGYENGAHEGFNWISARVEKLNSQEAKVPHIGWSEITPLDSQIFKRIRDKSFYFMHSYHFIPEEDSCVIARFKFGKEEPVAAIKKDNIIGFQFHPEKSQADGIRVLFNTLETLRC
ncbi:MAG: imidazole glycerol phosphate synthase subunit HisH [Aquificaceae bacterium]